MAPPHDIDDDLYAHLRAIAGRVHAEKGGSQLTIQPTELVHEAWAKVERSGGTITDRRHFLAVAARAMRQILVDRFRRRSAAKREGWGAGTTLSGLGNLDGGFDLLAIDEALSALESADSRAADVFVLRAFGGLTVPECAEELQVSHRTVDNAWRLARAFLIDALGK